MALAVDQLRQRLGATRFREFSRPDVPLRWGWAELSGRFAELSSASGEAALTWAMALVRDAQREGETTAWVMTPHSSWYPPDVAANGIDLGALITVRVPDAPAVSRAADRLARSGGFGLVVLDLGKQAQIPAALQSRFAQHALRQQCSILCLTEKPERAPSLGALVSLHAQAGRKRAVEGSFACTLTISKDKRNGPGWGQEELCHGPPGLR
jgi:recombination protein RecA